MKMPFLHLCPALLSLAIAPSATAAVFMVSATNDVGPGSLRQAIFDANTNAGPDEIRFSLPAGGRTIRPATGLPMITDTVTIDGTTQPGYSNAPMVELNGEDAAFSPFGVDGLQISASNCVVRGLVINRFANEGIEISQGGDNTPAGNTIELNFIGTDVTGTLAQPNENGVRIGTALGDNRILNNLVSGNSDYGIRVEGGMSNRVQGNRVGTDGTGTNPLPNQGGGIWIATLDTQVGGAAPGEGNLLSGNAGSALYLYYSGIGTTVQGNLIGTDATGGSTVNSFGNGIHILSNSNQVGGVGTGEGNTIAYQSGHGVFIEAGQGSTVRGNRIFANNGLGISGPLQDLPVLTNASVTASNVSVQGTFHSQPDSIYTLDFYANAVCDPSGAGEGEQWLGTAEIATDAIGDASFDVHLEVDAVGRRFLTATVTPPGGNTSRFSDCFGAAVTQPPLPEHLVYEPFAYMEGPLVGQSSGTGWLAPWTGTPDDTMVVSPGLEYTTDLGELDVAGLACEVNGFGLGSGAARILPYIIGLEDQTVYLSVLGRLDSAFDQVGLSLCDGANEEYFIGATELFGNWSSRRPDGADTLESAVPADTLALLVLRFDYAGPDLTLRLYVNPTLGPEPVSSVGQVTTTAFSFDQLKLRFQYGAGRFDEIRMGTTWDAVVPFTADIPTLSVADATVTEGDTGTTSLEFQVVLSHPVVSTVMVDYATSDITTTAGDDYTAVNGMLTFDPGESNQTVSVTVVGDTEPEGDEMLRLTLNNPVNATIADDTGVGTILSDELAPTLFVTGGRVFEGDAGTAEAVFQLLLDAPFAQSVSVDYATLDGTATAGEDYTASNGTAVIAAGATETTVVVTVHGDTTPEANEFLAIVLSHPVNVALRKPGHVGLIGDDDTPLDPGELLTIVEGGDPVPGEPDRVFDALLGAPSINLYNEVAFVARTVNAEGAGEPEVGVWVGTRDYLFNVVGDQSPAPPDAPAGTQYTGDFATPVIDDQGRVSYFASMAIPAPIGPARARNPRSGSGGNGYGFGCTFPVFPDGFASGNTAAWSSTDSVVPGDSVGDEVVNAMVSDQLHQGGDQVVFACNLQGGALGAILFNRTTGAHQLLAKTGDEYNCGDGPRTVLGLQILGRDTESTAILAEDFSRQQVRFMPDDGSSPAATCAPFCNGAEFLNGMGVTFGPWGLFAPATGPAGDSVVNLHEDGACNTLGAWPGAQQTPLTVAGLGDNAFSVNVDFMGRMLFNFYPVEGMIVPLVGTGDEVLDPAGGSHTVVSLEPPSLQAKLDRRDPLTGTGMVATETGDGKGLCAVTVQDGEAVEIHFFPVAPTLEVGAHGLNGMGMATARAEGSGGGDSETIVVIPVIDPVIIPQQRVDYGDAPDAGGPEPNYPTTQDRNGARHGLIEGGPRLGKLVDADPGFLQDPLAIADDATLTGGGGAVMGDDEDGVDFVSPVLPGCVANVDVEASTDARLDAWFDFNRDGDWDDPSEQIFTNLAVVAGTNHLSFAVPANSVRDYSYARFRISSTGGLDYVGYAADGEVEDYYVGFGIRLEGNGLDAMPGHLEFRWPDTCILFVLERTDSLAPPSWDVVGQGTLMDGMYHMTVSQPGYYRLRNPPP